MRSLRCKPHSVVRALGLGLAGLVVLGGIPGARLRTLSDTVDAAPVASGRASGLERTASLDVLVRAKATGLAIAHAHVRVVVEGERALPVAAVDTSDAGRATLRQLPVGEAWVMAEAPGWARAATRSVIQAATDAGVPELAFLLEPEHRLDVRVEDQAHRPVPDAEVELLAPGEPLPIGARTDANGIAHATHLSPGPWRIVARATGYEEGSARAEHDEETVAVVLEKRAAMDVHVVLASGQPASGAHVETTGAALWPPRSAETNVAGDVHIGGLAAGTYALRATLGSQVSPTELGIPLQVGSDEHVVLRLAPGRTVAVRVTDGPLSGAAAIAGARVTLTEGGVSPFPLETTTNVDGRAQFGPLTAGPAALGVRADGFVPRGGVPVLDPAPAEVRVALVRSGVVTGRVTDSRGRAIEGASIELVGTDSLGGPIFDDPRRARFQTAHFDAMLAGPVPLMAAGELGVIPGPVPAIPPSSPRLASSGFAAPLPVDSAVPRNEPSPMEPWVTRRDGTFRAAPASPGRIRAIVHHPEFVDGESGIVSLDPGGEAHVEVTLREGGALDGRVLDASDRPVAGAHLSISGTRGAFERTIRSGSDGSFRVSAIPDSVTVTVEGVDEDTPDVRLSVTIPEGGHQELTVRLPDRRDPLPVRVVDSSGWPVDSAQVSATSLAVETPLRTTAFTDGHGDALLKRARGLPLRVEVRAPKHAPKAIATDGANDNLQIELESSETATGEVSAAQGDRPVEGAEVTLITDLGVRHARTDARGAFALAELGQGPARLRVRAAGFAPATATLTVADTGGQFATQIPPVFLVGEGVVEGDVTDPHGQPLEGVRVAEGHVPTWLLVGANPGDVATTDRAGRFRLGELAEGTVTLEAYSPEWGRAHIADVRVEADRTTGNAHFVMTRDAAPAGAANEGAANAGSVAVTLGETGAPMEVVVVSVVGSSEAERAGVVPGDVLVAVDGAPVGSMDQARAALSGPLGRDVLLQLRRGEAALALRVPRDPLRH